MAILMGEILKIAEDRYNLNASAAVHAKLWISKIADGLLKEFEIRCKNGDRVDEMIGDIIFSMRGWSESGGFLFKEPDFDAMMFALQDVAAAI